jgi:LEA14-like dessication related protein
VRSVILIVALLAVGCSRPKPPTITPEKATITAIGPMGIDMLVQLGVDNPNRLDLAVRSVTAKVRLDGRYDLGTITIPQPVTLPARKRTELVVPLSIKWQDISALLSLAGVNRSVPYDVDGTVTLGGDLLQVDVPFRLTGLLTHEQVLAAARNSLPQLVR